RADSLLSWTRQLWPTPSPLATPSLIPATQITAITAPRPCFSLTGPSSLAPRPTLSTLRSRSATRLSLTAGAYRLNQRIVASVCLHRQSGGRIVVLSPCGVCRERLAVHGPDVVVAVAHRQDPTVIVWKPLKDVLPDYWMTAFPDEVDAAWTG